MDKIDSMYSVRQTQAISVEVEEAFRRILAHSQFIQGPEVKNFEQDVELYTGCKHAISCANGTDALTVALMALDLTPGEVVFTPSFTYVATAESIAILGGIPYFVDVDPLTFHISIQSLKDAIVDAKQRGLKLKAIISVDLFGAPVNYDELIEVAKENNLVLISDAAQSFGAKYKGEHVCNYADITTTSFFPTKPLACFGDGGMIMTNNDELAAIMRSICFHGKGGDKYTHIRVGMNSRLDSLQAAVLSIKLRTFENDIARRNQIAEMYSNGLRLPFTPSVETGKAGTWAVYNLKHARRDEIIEQLGKAGIPSNTYYHTPLHLQKPYTSALKSSSLLASEECAKTVFSLPLHSYLTDEQVMYIIENTNRIIESFEDK